MNRLWVLGAVVVALVVGFAAGRWTAPDVVVPLPPPARSSSPAAPSPTSEVRSATDPGSAVRLTASVTPEAGWMRVNATVTGFPDGETLRVVVVSRTGTRAVAATWVGSAAGSLAGTSVDGVVALARNDLAAVVVENAGGLQYASVTF